MSGGDGDAADDDEGRPTARRRRWPFVVAGVAVVVVALACWGWYEGLPDYRPGLEADERYGVDVSNHQGPIDWERVAADDVDFAYLKATEGGDFVDEQFARNWEGADAAGLDRGAYHFFTLCRPGADQAANFLRTVPRDPDALPPVVDLEYSGGCTERPDQAWLDRELGAFLEAVEEATGQTVVVYVMDDFDERYGVREGLDRPLWHRRLLRRPELDGWWMWQFHSKAEVDGIDGPSDLNVMRGERPPGQR